MESKNGASHGQDTKPIASPEKGEKGQRKRRKVNHGTQRKSTSSSSNHSLIWKRVQLVYTAEDL